MQTLLSETASQTPSTSIIVDGRTPDNLQTPHSEADCVSVVRGAVEQKTPLVPFGGGTALEQGNLLHAEHWTAVGTSAMNSLVTFSPEDMVVTVQAGMTLAHLQKMLAEKRQFLPLDPPQSDRATMGGIVATNAHGLWRPAFGTPRDRLLEARVVLASEADRPGAENGGVSVVRGGAKVVKNVAGYDLCKLFAGSWGTLGLFTEFTFKTNPLPETQTFLTFTGDSVQGVVEAADAALAIHNAQLQPVSLNIVRETRVCLTVGLMGSEKAVGWQTEQITALLRERNWNPADAPMTETAVRETLAGEEMPLKGRVTVAPSLVPTTLAALAPRLTAGGSNRLLVSPIPGVIEFACGLETGEELETVRNIGAALPPTAYLVWTRLPLAWKTDVDVWGRLRGDFPLMRMMKTRLDPLSLFSPGRFVGRL